MAFLASIQHSMQMEEREETTVQQQPTPPEEVAEVALVVRPQTQAEGLVQIFTIL
jgi:hypothetical protein